MFLNLSERFESIFKGLKQTGSIDEKSFDEAMRDIRRALLEADVALSVAKEFINHIRQESIGKEVLRSITPAQMITKIVNDELVKTLGGSMSDLQIDENKSNYYLFAGLQGSGKTTTVAKIANYLKNKKNKSVLTVSLDINRPAAFDQLKKLSDDIGISILPKVENQMPIDISKRAIEFAKLNNIDCILLDTAGRTNIDDILMNELSQLEKEISPIETLLVLDSLTGQDAVNVVKDFSNKIKLSCSIAFKR